MWPKFAFLGLVIIRLMVSANPDAKRLYDDLLSSYNKLVRPVVNTSDVLRVSIKLKLSQLIDVVRTQNNVIWLEHSTYLLIIMHLVCILIDKLATYRYFFLFSKLSNFIKVINNIIIFINYKISLLLYTNFNIY